MRPNGPRTARIGSAGIGPQRGAGYVSPHDKIVLKAAKEWEIRYRAMYPNS